MYKKIKDKIETDFNVEIFSTDDNIFFYSNDDEISYEMLQSINRSIEKYDYSFVQQNLKIAFLVKNE